MSAKKPVHSIKRGSIEVAIWENEGKGGSFFRATFSRTYRNAEGAYRDSSSFSARELGDLALLVLQAQAWMVDTERREKAEQAPDVVAPGQ